MFEQEKNSQEAKVILAINSLNITAKLGERKETPRGPSEPE